MKANFVSLMASAALTDDGSATGVDIGELDGWGRIILNAGQTAGADNTADFKIEHSADGSTGWTEFAKVSFDQVVNSAASFQVASVNFSEMKKFARVTYDLAGTDPKVVAGVIACGPSQYLG